MRRLLGKFGANTRGVDGARAIIVGLVALDPLKALANGISGADGFALSDIVRRHSQPGLGTRWGLAAPIPEQEKAWGSAQPLIGLVRAGDHFVLTVRTGGRPARNPGVSEAGVIAGTRIVNQRRKGDLQRRVATHRIGHDFLNDGDIGRAGRNFLDLVASHRILDVPHAALAVYREAERRAVRLRKDPCLVHLPRAVLGKRDIHNVLADVVCKKVRPLVRSREGGTAVYQPADDAGLLAVVAVGKDRVVVKVALAAWELAVLAWALTERPAKVVAGVDDVDVLGGLGVVVAADLGREVSLLTYRLEVPGSPVEVPSAVGPAGRGLLPGRQVARRNYTRPGDTDHAAGVLVALLRPLGVKLVANAKVDVTVRAPAHLTAVVPEYQLTVGLAVREAVRVDPEQLLAGWIAAAAGPPLTLDVLELGDPHPF